MAPLDPRRLLAILAASLLAPPAHAVDNPDACQALAQTAFASEKKGPIALTLDAPDLAAQTAFLNWSPAPARPDLPLQGDQIEVTTCWYTTPKGQTCMMGFLRERPPHPTGTLVMQPLGSEPCAE